MTPKVGGGLSFGFVCEWEAGSLTLLLQIFAGVVESRMPNTVCTALFIELRETRNGGWYGNDTVGPRLKRLQIERVCACVCVLTGKAGKETWLFILMFRCISLCSCFLEPILYGGMPSLLGGLQGEITKGQLPNQIHH